MKTATVCHGFVDFSVRLYTGYHNGKHCKEKTQECTKPQAHNSVFALRTTPFCLTYFSAIDIFFCTDVVSCPQWFTIEGSICGRHNTTEIESNLSYPVTQGCLENALIVSFEISTHSGSLCLRATLNQNPIQSLA